MNHRERNAGVSGAALFLLIMLTAACAPTRQPTAAMPAQPTPTAAGPVVTVTETPAATVPAQITDTPGSAATWPAYSLATALPSAPARVRLYKQAFPAGLPTQARLAALMAQLKIKGTVSTQTDEGGATVLSVTGNAASLRLWSEDPLLLVLENGSPAPDNGTPVTGLSAELRMQNAKAFLSARGLLDFPYVMEAPRLSRERGQAMRIVPLIDGYPLYDYDALNGRLLVLFNQAGEVSTVFWRPLKVDKGDLVDIIPAAAAWDQLLKGDTPQPGATGQCWQATVFDASEPNPEAQVSSPACVSWGGGLNPAYEAAAISDVRLVYFAHDLSLGMSPFAFPADSPVRIVFPMWQFSGSTSDGHELVVLWPAVQKP